MVSSPMESARLGIEAIDRIDALPPRGNAGRTYTKLRYISRGVNPVAFVLHPTI